MTTYIPVGATTPDGERIATKTLLKRILLGGKIKGEPVAAQPSEVVFDNTGHAAGRHGDDTYRGDAIPEDVTLQVAGPDPYNQRAWFASVKLVNGKIVVT